MWPIAALVVAAAVGSATPANHPDWITVDARSFSLRAPAGTHFTPLDGVDSYVGAIVGSGFNLSFDYGQWSTDFSEYSENAAYRTSHDHTDEGIVVDGRPSRLLIGTGVGGCPDRVAALSVPKVAEHTKLSMNTCVSRANLQVVVDIFRSIRFALPPPRNTTNGKSCAKLKAEGFVRASERCEREAALAKGNIDSCSGNVQERFACILEIARKNDDPTLCELAYSEIPDIGRDSVLPRGKGNVDECIAWVSGTDPYRSALDELPANRSAAVATCEQLRLWTSRNACLTWLSDRLAGFTGSTRREYDNFRGRDPDSAWVATCLGSPSPAEWKLCIRGFIVDHLTSTGAYVARFREQVRASPERERAFCDAHPTFTMGRPAARDLANSLCSEPPRETRFILTPWPP